MRLTGPGKGSCSSSSVIVLLPAPSGPMIATLVIRHRPPRATAGGSRGCRPASGRRRPCSSAPGGTGGDNLQRASPCIPLGLLGLGLLRLGLLGRGLLRRRPPRASRSASAGAGAPRHPCPCLPRPPLSPAAPPGPGEPLLAVLVPRRLPRAVRGRHVMRCRRRRLGGPPSTSRPAEIGCAVTSSGGHAPSSVGAGRRALSGFHEAHWSQADRMPLRSRLGECGRPTPERTTGGDGERAASPAGRRAGPGSRAAGRRDGRRGRPRERRRAGPERGADHRRHTRRAPGPGLPAAADHRRRRGVDRRHGSGRRTPRRGGPPHRAAGQPEADDPGRAERRAGARAGTLAGPDGCAFHRRPRVRRCRGGPAAGGALGRRRRPQGRRGDLARRPGDRRRARQQVRRRWIAVPPRPRGAGGRPHPLRGLPHRPGAPAAGMGRAPRGERGLRVRLPAALLRRDAAVRPRTADLLAEQADPGRPVPPVPALRPGEDGRAAAAPPIGPSAPPAAPAARRLPRRNGGHRAAPTGARRRAGGALRRLARRCQRADRGHPRRSAGTASRPGRLPGDARGVGARGVVPRRRAAPPPGCVVSAVPVGAEVSSGPVGEHVDFDLHGIVGIRVLEPRPGDIATVPRQLGPLQAPLHRPPDITVRFVDELAVPGPITYAGWPDCAADDEGFYLLRGKEGVAARTLLPLDGIGSLYEIVVERSAGPVPHLLAVVNMTALARGVLPLHASAFTYRGTGVLATGWAKGGKTETLLAFAARGAHYVGDEWVYLTPDGGMHGVPEPIRLWYWHVAQLPELRAELTPLTRTRLRALPPVARS